MIHRRSYVSVNASESRISGNALEIEPVTLHVIGARCSNYVVTKL